MSDFDQRSLADIPTQMTPDLTIGAITPRGDPRDALVLHPSLPSATTLSSLPENSTIGTSSVRRSAQLKRLYPHLRFQSVRGNVNTRLRKLDESVLEESRGSGARQGESHTVEEDASAGKTQYSAVILAAAGLIRLNEGHRVSRYLSSKNLEDVRGPDGAYVQRKGMLHAVGQGALGIQIREGDKRIVDLLAPLNCHKTSLAVCAERSLMRTLEGGCSVPIGVETEWTDAPFENGSKSSPSPTTRGHAVTGTEVSAPLGNAGKESRVQSNLILRTIVVSLDGLESVEKEASRVIKTDEEADQFGWDVAKMLVDEGAASILEKINLKRTIIEKQGEA